MAGDFLGGVGVRKTGSTFRGRVEDLFLSGQGATLWVWCGGDKNGGRHSMSGQNVISWVCESHFWGRVE